MRRRALKSITSLVLVFLLLFNQAAWAGSLAVGAAGTSPAAGKKGSKKDLKGAEFAPGEIIVKYKSGAASMAPLHKGLKTKVVRNLKFKNTQLVKVDATADWEKTLKAYIEDPRVEYAEPNYKVRALADPNDSMYSQQWGLPKIQAPEAWGVAQATGDVKIAIIDTGVDLNHPDLAGAIGTGIDLVIPGTPPDDENGHGTHVAGIAAAVTNNGQGIAGVAGGATIMPVRVLDQYGDGWLDDIADGIRWAADNGADVINLSIGVEFYTQLLEDAVNYAVDRGVVVVAASGNEAQYGNPVEYPAGYDRVIAVGATDNIDGWATFSNYGNYVDIAAPGVNILSTTPDTQVNPDLPLNYATESGTSMATPHVAGVAALVLSKYPGLTPYQVETRLKMTADDRGAVGPDSFYGYGRVNAFRAVNTPDSDIPADIYEPNNTLETAKSASLGTSFVATLNPASDTDWYKYSFSSSTIKVSLKVPTGINGKVEVFDRTGLLVRTIDAGGAGAAEISYVPVAPGDWYFKVSESSGLYGTEPYILKVEDSDSYEPNNSFQEAPEIPYNTSIQAKITPAGDVDYYKINIPKTAGATLTLQPPSAMDGVLSLYNSAGQLLTEADVGYEGGSEKITSQLNAGVYYIGVTDYWEEAYFSTYTLNVSLDIDLVPPSVQSTNPANNTTDVFLNKNITVNYSENVTAGPNYSLITLRDGSGNIITTNSIVANTLLVDPLLLNYSTTYTLDIPAGAVTDLSGNESSAQSLTFTTGSDDTVFNFMELPFTVTDAVADPVYPVVYITNKTEKKLYAVNYRTGQISSLSFSYQPESLELGYGQYADELYVALLHQDHSSYWWSTDQAGTIAVIDTNTFTQKDTIPIQVDPYDLIAGRDGYIYVPPGSGQWANLDSYNRSTKTRFDRATSVYESTTAALHPTMNRLYTTNNTISPNSLRAQNITNGDFQTSYSWGLTQYLLSKKIKIDPTGQYLFSGTGYIFTTRPDQAQDMKYAGTLDRTYNDIAFESDMSKIYTVPTGFSKVNIYNNSFARLLQQYTLRAPGKFLFKKDSQLIALTDPAPGTSYKTGLQILDLDPPRVTATNPSNNAVIVVLNQPITINFNRTIQAGEDLPYISLVSEASTVPVTSTVSGQTLTVYPQQNLAYGQIYTLNVPDRAVSDLSGNFMAAFYNLTFSTQADTAAPTGTLLINNGAARTRQGTVTLTVNASDNSGAVSAMQFSNDGTTWSGWEGYNATKTWNLSSGDGTKTVYARVKDAAGNISEVFQDSIILDTVAPSVTINSPAALTFDNTPLINFSVSDGTVTVFVDGSPVSKVSGDSLDLLPDGQHTLRVEATDEAGNTGIAEKVFTVNTAGPIINIIAPAAGFTNDNTPLLNYTVSEGTVTVTVDGNIVNKISGDSLDALAEGPHTLRVEAIDVEGDASFAEVSFTVDTIIPSVSITSPTRPTKDNTPAIAYSVSEGTVVVKVDENVVNKVSGDSLDMLVDGIHTLRVEATDAAGNTGFAQSTFSVDTSIPTGSVVINSGAAFATTTQVTLNLSASDSTGYVSSMRFSNDGVTWSASESAKSVKDWTLPPGDGEKQVCVRFYDAAYNYCTVSDTIILDTTAPTVTINTPSGMTKDSTPLLGYTVSDGSAVVKVDGTAVNKVSGDSLDALADGTHTLRVEATDAAGNTGFAEASFTVDTTAPVVTIGAPPVLTNDATPMLTYAASDGSVVVRVDGNIVNKGSGDSLDELSDGLHTVRVEATDAAGNIGFAERAFTVDTVALTVDLLAPASGITNDNTPLLLYNTEGGTVIVKVDDKIVPKISGNSLDTLADGPHTVRVEATDAAGNTGSDEVNFVVDTTAPTITINAPAAGLTNDNTPFLGYAVSDGTVAVKVDGVVVNEVSGNSLDTLGEGSHTVRIEATDAAGNTSFAERTFTVDTIAPVVTISAPPAITNDPTPAIVYTAIEGTVVVKVDDVAVNKASGDSLDTLADGPHSIRVEATDAAGNKGSSDRSFLVDTVSPTVNISSPSSGLTNDNTPLLNYTVNEGNVVVKVDGEVVQKSSGDSLDPLAEGSHSLRVEATDSAGNTGVAVKYFTVDSTAPLVSINGIPLISNNPTPVIGYVINDETVIVRVKVKVNGLVVDKVSGDSLDHLADGTHTLRVEATDSAGNIGVAERSFTVDTASPVVTVNSPGGLTNDNTPLLTYTASDGTVTVKVDGVVVNKVSGDSLNTLGDGSHTVLVEAIDAAGNSGSREVTFVVDTTAPTVSITSPAEGLTKDNTPLLTFIAGGTVTVKVDGVVVNKVSGDSLDALDDGLHTVRVDAVDAAGNTAFAERTFTVDTLAPVVTINAPPAITNDPTPVISYAASDGTIAVKVDDVVVNKVSGDSLDTLTDGWHTIRIEATDAAGNTGATEASCMVDTLSPTVSISSPLAGLTNDNTPLLNYNVSEGTVVVKVDGVIVNKSPGDSLNALGDGSHSIRVEATDAAGNIGVTERVFTVDTAAPLVTINSPGGLTNDNTPLLNYTASDGNVVVKVDGVAVNKSSGASLDTLAEGSHTVRIEATDAVGNTSSAVRTFTVDTIAPAVIINAPPPITNDHTPVIDYLAGEGTVVVKVSGAIVSKTSGDSLDYLSDGSHTLRVEVTDAAGNVGFAERSFIIDNVAPVVALYSPGSGYTNNNKPLLSYSAGGGTAVVKVDGNVVNKASGTTLDTLADGSHTVRVESTDAAGNTGFSQVSFTVDTQAPVVNIVSPAPGLTGDNTPLLEYSVNEGTVVVKVDNVTVNKLSGDSLSTLADGSHTLQVESYDKAGNRTSKETTFVVDTALPTGTVTINGGALYTNQFSVNLALTATDNSGPVGQMQFSNDGGTWNAWENYRQTKPWTLTPGDGVKTVFARFRDSAGNVSVVYTANIILDTQLANPVLNNPGKINLNNAAAFSLSGTAEAGSNIEVTINDGSANVSAKTVASTGGAWVVNTNVAGLKDGEISILVTSADAAGNSGSVTAATRKDVIAPSLTASVAKVLTNRVNTVIVRSDEDLQGIPTVTTGTNIITMVSSGAREWTGTWTKQETDGDGLYSVSVNGTDLAGNMVTNPAAAIFTLDATAPAAPLLDESGVVNASGQANVLISGVAEPGALVEITLTGLEGDNTLSLNAAAHENGEFAVSVDTNPLGDGTINVSAVAVDAAGNRSSAGEGNFFKDTLAPVSPVIIGPQVINQNNTGEYIINGSAEPETVIDLLLSDGSNDMVASVEAGSDGLWAVAFDAGLLDDGPVTITATATDFAGNIGEVSRYSTVKDTKEPVLTVDVSPQITNDDATITVLSDEPLLEAPSATVGGRQVEFAPTGPGQWSGTWTRGQLDPDGAYPFTVYAPDVNGNTGTESGSFVLDTRAPDITGVKIPAYINSSNKAAVTISGTAEAGASVDLMMAGSEGGTPVESSMVASDTGAFSFTVNASGLRDGGVIVTVTATDTAGNIGDQARQVTKDTVAPAITFDPPDYSTDVSTGASFNLTWRGADRSPSSGLVYDVQYHAAGVSTWTKWKTGFTGTYASFPGAAGNTYYFQARAMDRAGNAGGWVGGKTVVPYDNDRYSAKSGFNSRENNSAYYSGSVRYSTRANESISYTFSGNTVALITTKARNRSKARIYVDGVLAATVDASSSTTKYRQVLYQKTWSKPGTHTVRIVNLGTARRTRFDVDAVAVGK